MLVLVYDIKSHVDLHAILVVVFNNVVRVRAAVPVLKYSEQLKQPSSIKPLQ